MFSLERLKKNLGLKKCWVREKGFWVGKKNFIKEFLVCKNFGSLKNFGSKKNFGPRKFLVPKNFEPKKFWVLKKILGLIDILDQKIVNQNEFWAQNI